MNLNPLNPHYGSYMLAEIAIQSEKLRLYPNHHIDCVIHDASDVCNCGREEFEQEVAAEETEAEVQDNDSAEETEAETQENDSDGEQSSDI